jgi:MOSC domain-containing protein YiiM
MSDDDDDDPTLRELIDTVPQVGRLEWIGVRTERLGPLTVLERATLVTDRGIEGDRYEANGSGGKRQVSIIAAEHLDIIAKLTGRDRVPPELVRRNLVVSGINVHSIKSLRFRIGGAVLEGTGDCAPCSRMETALGKGGYVAMRGHGGITARVIAGGTVRIGDAVRQER